VIDSDIVLYMEDLDSFIVCQEVANTDYNYSIQHELSIADRVFVSKYSLYTEALHHFYQMQG